MPNVTYSKAIGLGTEQEAKSKWPSIWWMPRSELGLLACKRSIKERNKKGRANLFLTPLPFSFPSFSWQTVCYFSHWFCLGYICFRLCRHSISSGTLHDCPCWSTGQDLQVCAFGGVSDGSTRVSLFELYDLHSGGWCLYKLLYM